MSLSHRAAFTSRDDLKKYGANARLLFALETRFQLDDIHSTAATSLTDGRDDKKIDIVFVDTDSGVVVVGQGYEALDETKTEAPSNKAADLNTAIGWLLGRPVKELPTRLQSAATAVRAALEAGEVTSFHLWYVHNLPESANVGGELRTAETTLRNALASNYPKAELTECAAIEVGRKTLEEWYQALQAPILVTDSFEIDVPGAYEIKGNNWKSAVTSIPGTFLYDLWQRHGSDVFSANVRDYLGSRRSDRNVNHGIKTTASDRPASFWVFNNGVTALVNSFAMSLEETGATRLKISGVSIVNGAQTTGALGSLTHPPAVDVMVQARFVQCTDMATIKDIIAFNNTQNVVKPTDFRSNDAVQRRLRDEFAKIPLAEYHGGRRGGEADLIRRPPNLLPTDTCSQALASLHGDPTVAYNRKSQIWESDSLYAKYFNEQTSAAHILFAFSLLRAVEDIKMSLLAAVSAGQTLSATQEEQLEFLRRRGSTFLVVAAIGRCLEAILGRALPNLFRLSFGPIKPDDARLIWQPIVDVCLSFCSQLSAAIDNGLKNQTIVASSIGDFRRMIEATKKVNAAVYSAFEAKVVEAK